MSYFPALFVSVRVVIVFTALHTRYIFRTDPLLFGGCVHATQVLTYSLSIHLPRLSVLISGVLPLPELTHFWYIFSSEAFVHYSGVRRGPVPSYIRMFCFVLEACRHNMWVMVPSVQYVCMMSVRAVYPPRQPCRLACIYVFMICWPCVAFVGIF